MRFVFAFFLAGLCAAQARADAILTGALEQGGLVYGRALSGAKVFLNGQEVAVSPEGYFVLGFAREAEAKAELRIRAPDGKEERQSLKIAARSWDIQRIDGLPEKHVTPDAKTLERIKAENAQLSKARARRTLTPYFLAGLIRPLEGRISGVFGSQRILNGEPRAPHSGVDIAAPEGAPVYASADGVVAFVHPDMFFTGKTALVDHGLGLFSVYAHLSAISVQEGQFLKQGAEVGKVGATGRATGPHLHWGLSWGEVKLDPAQALDHKPAP